MCICVGRKWTREILSLILSPLYPNDSYYNTDKDSYFENK